MNCRICRRLRGPEPCAAGGGIKGPILRWFNTDQIRQDAERLHFSGEELDGIGTIATAVRKTVSRGRTVSLLEIRTDARGSVTRLAGTQYIEDVKRPPEEA